MSLRSRLIAPVLGSAFCALALDAPSFAQTPDMPALTPLPASMTVAADSFLLNARTRIYVPAGDEDALTAANWLRDTLLRTRGLTLKVTSGAPTDAPKNAIVFVRLATFAATNPDAYHLDVSSNAVRIASANHGGLFYGAVTAWQLATQDDGKGPVKLAAVTIDDQPAYAWRGLMVDSCRHFQPVGEIKKIIDAMAMQKLNVMQWNLADDQAWRLEVPAYPKLTQVGAFRQEAGAAGIDPRTGKPIMYGGFYTEQDVRDVVAYALARNIMVVPEIDMPGHATAAITAYPELGAEGTPPRQGLGDWGVYPNLYNVDDKTFVFIDNVLDEVMELFKSPFIHIGGDEAIKPQWKASPAIQAKIKALGLKDEDALQSWFITRVGQHIQARGRRLIGWDEILQGGVAPDATVMSWRGIQGAIDAAKLGHDTVLSPAPDLYLDNRQSDAADEGPGRGFTIDLKRVYAFNPAPDAISPDDRKHILGLQANVWTEHVRTDGRFEWMAFPRVVAVAEVGWSPAASRNWDSFAHRLPADLTRLRDVGIGYDEVPFEPQATLAYAAPGKAQVMLANALDMGQLRYTTNGKAPTMRSPAATGALTLPVGATLTVQTFFESKPLGGVKTYRLSSAAIETRNSFQMPMCAGKLNLDLEDDAPTNGTRPAIRQDIMDECVVWKDADLSHGVHLTVHIADFPFNFQLADSLKDVTFDPPKTPGGELNIRADDCKGAVIASVPLGGDAKNPGISTVEADLPAMTGTHDLCFSFSQDKPAPEWAVQDVRLTQK